MSLADERGKAAATGGSALIAVGRAREHGREVLEEEAPIVTLFRRSDFL